MDDVGCIFTSEKWRLGLEGALTAESVDKVCVTPQLNFLVDAIAAVERTFARNFALSVETV